MELYNMILQRLRNEERKFELIQPKLQRDKTFGDLINYIKYIFEFLWKNPYVVSEILSKADIYDVKKCLAHFFTINFYENNLSNNNKEGQLLYIITLQLKKEINKIFTNDSNNNINGFSKNFLSDTPCSFIFEELFYKKEIQSFFKPIIIDLIKELESSYPSQEIIFNPSLIYKYILLERKQRKESKEKEKESDVDITKFRKSIYKKDKNINEKIKLFNEKYQFGLQKEQLVELSQSYEDKNMVNYINQKILECSDNPFLYSSSVFLENVNFTKMSNNIGDEYKDEERKDFSQNILAIYQQSYFEVIHIIDKLIDNLISNMHLMPYIIKCINKIILLIIDKKFPSLFAFEKNVFINKFFFNKLFFPLLINPSIYVLINDFIISDNTILNLNNIISIMNKFAIG
jgi:hypothetical protein